MIDSFVVLAPLLVLPVVGLLGFVGCDQVFGLTYVSPPMPGPANLIATPGNTKVSLSWDADPDATSYKLKRGVTSGVYTAEFVIDAALASYTDTMLNNGTTYFYVVTSLRATGESSRSDEVSATPTAAALIPFVTSFTGVTSVGTVTGLYGMAIQVGANSIDVQSLGRGFVAGNSQIHVVKIVDASGVDVPNGFVSVNMSGGAPGQFNYALLNPPVTLAANTKYYIVSQEISGQDKFFNHDETIQTTDVATVVSSVHSGPPYVEDLPGVHSYVPVSFQY